MANVHSRIQRAAAASDRICSLMDRRPGGRRQAGGRRGSPGIARRSSSTSVEFSYNGRDPVLRGLDLSVRHGETIALVGPNGCGKSTLMNLLPRFWDVQSGAIRIDGHDIRDVQLRSLRSQIGMVIQETILFEDTIANNIAYGHRHACRDAGRGRRQACLRPPVHRRLARRLRHGDRRTRARPLRRPAAAHRPGPRHAPRPGHPDPRRGHQRRRHPGRGPDPQGHRGVRAQPDHLPRSPTASARSSSPTASS